jgi:UDP-N-acetylmuramate dehydrogenase
MVSPKHANFLVNAGAATAADVEKLVAHIQETVQRQFDVTLTPEFHTVGQATGQATGEPR